MVDARTDEVDTRVKNNADFTLRSRVQAVYSIPNTPLGIVGKVEVLSTLNAPVDYINSVANSQSPANIRSQYGEYISELRPELGLQWKINKQHTLGLSYRYNYLYGRDAKVQELGDVSITNKYTTKHLILLTYKLGW